MRTRLVLVLGSLFLLACSCETTTVIDRVEAVTTLPYFNDPDFTPIWIDNNGPSIDTLHKVLDFSLTNQNGELINQDLFKGKIYVANFFFTACPGICPKLTNNFNKLQEEFKDDDSFLLLSHSVMPSTDSVKVLKKYAKQYNVDDSKWHLVTGSENDIKKLARFSYFSDD